MSQFSHTLPDSASLAILELVSAVQRDLLNPANVQWFAMQHDTLPEARDATNQAILASIGREGGVYAIWAERAPEGPCARYIGQTAGATARQRIRNHFITKDPRTGSQLENVNNALREGYRVGVTFVAIQPAYMRLVVEEMLINGLTGDCWNIKSKLRILPEKSAS